MGDDERGEPHDGGSDAGREVTSARLRVAAVTHPGLVREDNEDAVVIGEWIVADRRTGNVAVLELSGPGPFTVAVADGLGGHACGEAASRLVVEMLATSGVPLVGDAISKVLDDANVALLAEGARDPARAGSGCTIAGVTFDGEQAWVFNVGDSRVYRALDGHAGQLTVDDRPPRMPGQPPDVPTSVLTQCLGGTTDPRPVEPHVRVEVLQAHDTFLLCSDGLSDYVRAGEIGTAAGTASAAGVKALLARALDAGAPDNVTIVLATWLPSV